VGDVTSNDAVTRIGEAFGSWEARPDSVPTRAGPPPPVGARRVLVVDKPDASQAQIRIGAMAMRRNDPDLLTAQVANTVLGGGFSSILVDELRIKRSLTYGASSMFVARLTGGDFRINTFSKSPTAAQALALALDVEGGFRRKPIDPKLLDKAKSYLRGQFPLRLETPEALAARLAEIEFFGLPKDELATYEARVAAVTPATASSEAERWMPNPNAVAIVVVGKAAELRPALESRFGWGRVATRWGCAARTPWGLAQVAQSGGDAPAAGSVTGTKSASGNACATSSRKAGGMPLSRTTSRPPRARARVSCAFRTGRYGHTSPSRLRSR